MKFITRKQPIPSLVAAGACTILTDSRTTDYRGPLAIVAGKARPEHLSRVADWWVHSQFTEPESGPELRRLGSVLDGKLVADRHERGLAVPMPLGAVVAVCDLVDVVPIVDPSCCPAGDHVCLLRTPELVQVGGGGERSTSIADQIPFGDFTPGRWAWLIDNARPVTPPVPLKGGQGLRDLPADITSQLPERGTT